MPSIEETKRQVKEQLDKQVLEPDHDSILASLQDEIDRHNAIKDDTERYMRKDSRHGHRRRDCTSSVRFRFKEGTSDPRKHKSRSKDGAPRRSHKRRRHDKPSSEEARDTAHPFPRNDSEDVNTHGGSEAAFRDALFDALADDEGAAYWESVYSQPIHVYARPSVENELGELEQMDDEEYAAYVQTKMWERKHPDVVRERENRSKFRAAEEEKRAKRKADFVRRKEREAWERAQAWREGESDSEEASRPRARYEFTGHANTGPEIEDQHIEYVTAWSAYLAAWDKLKNGYAETQNVSSKALTGDDVRRMIPWPVVANKPVTQPNIAEFMRNAPSDAEHSMHRILKLERVRWHPDKIQQRFGGKVDKGTMQLVTGVFQTVDGIFEEARKSQSSG